MAGPTRRPRAQQGNGERLRRELLEGAARLLESGGPEAVTLRGVARGVGVSAPSIYLHFENREQLLAAALAYRFERFDETIRAAINSARTPAERLRAGCLAYCEFAIAEPAAYQVLFSGTVHHAVAEMGRSIGHESFATLVGGVAAVMEVPGARGGEPFAVARKTWTALHGLSTLRSGMPEFDWNPLEDAVDELLADCVGLDNRQEAPNMRKVHNKR